jgi:hypothetical protein
VQPAGCHQGPVAEEVVRAARLPRKDSGIRNLPSSRSGDKMADGKTYCQAHSFSLPGAHRGTVRPTAPGTGHGGAVRVGSPPVLCATSCIAFCAGVKWAKQRFGDWGYWCHDARIGGMKVCQHGTPTSPDPGKHPLRYSNCRRDNDGQSETALGGATMAERERA